MKKVIYVFLCVAVLSNMLCVNALAENTAVDDKAYSEAAELLSAINVLPEGTDCNEGSFITRGEFADMILKFTGINTSEITDSEIVDGKYVGYADRKPEEDSWIWIDESQPSQSSQGFTPYYDVSTEHKYWDSINTASQLGLMSGDTDRRFRPDERITSNEVIKVLVTVVGAGELANGNYPSGYFNQAAALGIIDSLKTKDFSGFITYRDLAVMLFNTLESDVYEYEWEMGNRILKRSDRSYMESVLDLYREQGVVTNNRFTGTDGKGTELEGRIKVNGIYFDAPGLSADDYLGYDATIYYYSDDFDYDVVCIRKTDKNKELLIDSEDIEGYTKPNLHYYSGTRSKSVYVGADTTIVYNGKLLDDYKESDLTPENGSIRLVDNNSDGRYEYAFIDSVKTIVVSGTDVTNEIIYNKLKKGDSIKLDGMDYIITGSDDTETSLEGIVENEVLDVRQSINKNGTGFVQIDVSGSSVKGRVTSISLTTGEISINGTAYDISVYAELDDIKSGDEGVFYLDTDNKVVYSRLSVGLAYAYLVNLLEDADNSCYFAKLYTMGDDVERYEFADRIKIDGVSMKKENAYKRLKESAEEKYKSGVVKYELSEEGKLANLMFPDNNGDLFVTFAENDSNQEIQYRDINKSYNLPHKSLCYRDSDTVYINAPLTDATDESAYFRISYSGDDYLKFSKIYADKKDSKIARIIVWNRDVSNTKTVSDNEICYMLKSKTRMVDKNDEIITVLTGVSSAGTVNFEVDESEIVQKLEELSTGDLFRVTKNVVTGRVQAYEKVFDADDRYFVTKQNPTLSAPDQFVNSQYHVLHGMVYQKTDNNVYLDVAPYIYTTDSEGNTTVGAADTADLYPYKAQDFTTVVFDTSRKAEKVYVGSHMTDILASEVVGESDASEVVVNSWWGSPRTIFVYK
ncbi:MAG: S-layer homology domain-containing protein [Clostridia bacterium]|nr:S-layer homology domain-containing protein [Clostridia bacterium]